MNYNKINTMITDEWCKLIQNLILDGHCDEFDGNGFNVFVDNVKYIDNYDVLFVSVSKLNNNNYCLEVYYERDDGNDSGFAPFNTLSIDAAIDVYQQVKKHSGQFKDAMIDYIIKNIKKADVKDIANFYNTIVK